MSRYLSPGRPINLFAVYDGVDCQVSSIDLEQGTVDLRYWSVISDPKDALKEGFSYSFGVDWDDIEIVDAVGKIVEFSILSS